MDYRKFLGATESLVLPYFGGMSVDAPTRRLRVESQTTLTGWLRFEVKGRVATPKERADVPDLSALPIVRGHLVGDALVQGGTATETVHFLPEEEAPLMSPAHARRWVSGELVFDALDFEGDAEEGARRALEEGMNLTEVKGVGASLRAAFGLAVLATAVRRTGIQASPLEVRAHLLAFAEGGLAAAETVLRGIEAERERHDARLRARNEARRQADLRREEDQRRDALLAQVRAWERTGAPAEARRRPPHGDPQTRAEAALDAAGARVVATRKLGGGRGVEVTFTFMGQRFISVADEDTLQVSDAGICLSGRDDMVTLESLPSVIKEAIDTHRLVITRR